MCIDGRPMPSRRATRRIGSKRPALGTFILTSSPPCSPVASAAARGFPHYPSPQEHSQSLHTQPSRDKSETTLRPPFAAARAMSASGRRARRTRGRARARGGGSRRVKQQAPTTLTSMLRYRTQLQTQTEPLIMPWMWTISTCHQCPASALLHQPVRCRH